MLLFGITSVRPPMEAQATARYQEPTYTSPPADPPPPGDSGVQPTPNTVYTPGAVYAPSRTATPPPDAAVPSRTYSGGSTVTAPTGWPPSCPAGTMWNDEFHACVSYESSTYMPVTSAGPSIYVRQNQEQSAFDNWRMSKGAKIALALFGLGALALGAFSIIRR